MTALEVYDLALKDYPDPAVFREGEACVLGYWGKREEAGDRRFFLRTSGVGVDGERGVIEVARAASWDEVARAAGL